MTDRSVTFENVLKWTVIIILAIFALKVIATILGIAFLVGSFLFWRVLPLVLFVGLLYLAWQWLTRNGSASDSI